MATKTGKLPRGDRSLAAGCRARMDRSASETEEGIIRGCPEGPDESVAAVVALEDKFPH